MNTAILWTLAIMGPVWLAAIGAFAVWVIGIRKGDRSHLGNAPQARSDKFARCLLSTCRDYNKEGGE